MSTGKISWMIDENDWLTIIKVDGLAFPEAKEGQDEAQARFEHMKKYKIGTRLSLKQFCNNADYHSIMWTVVPKDWTHSVTQRQLVINV